VWRAGPGARRLAVLIVSPGDAELAGGTRRSHITNPAFHGTVYFRSPADARSARLVDTINRARGTKITPRPSSWRLPGAGARRGDFRASRTLATLGNGEHPYRGVYRPVSAVVRSDSKIERVQPGTEALGGFFEPLQPPASNGGEEQTGKFLSSAFGSASWPG